MSPRSLSQDPYLSFPFRVLIEGESEENLLPPKKASSEPVGAGFSEVTGLTIETNTESFREGGCNGFERQLAGPAKYPEKLVLKRGLSSLGLWNWYKAVVTGSILRKDITITLLEYENSKAKLKWVFRKACPVKWTGPQLKAGTAEVAFESIELIHRGLTENSIEVSS